MQKDLNTISKFIAEQINSRAKCAQPFCCFENYILKKRIIQCIN